MPRPPGRRNADYEATRMALVERLAGAMVASPGARLSFRQMAEAVGVSATTLRHYFGTREDVVREVFASIHRAGLPHLHAVAVGPTGPLADSLRWFAEYVLEGWRAGVGALHELGLSEGLGDASIGPAYVKELLEPTLQAAESRIARHVASGELERCDVRRAAIALVAPLFVALLHQESLGGARCRPLEMGAFVDDHLERFVRAFAPSFS